jgi:hypothetical protein
VPREPVTAHDILEDAALSPAGPSRGGPGHIHAIAAWLSGRSSGLWADQSRFANAIGAPSSRRFPARAIRTSASDGGRSHSPLRGSPGFAPGSLLTRH